MRTMAVFSRAAVGTIVGLGLGCGVADAAPTLQATFTATQDTYVSELNPTTVYGAATSMQHTAGWYNAPQNLDQLYVGFGNLLATVPADASIFRATVTLSRTADPGTTNARACLTTTAWNETSLTWNTRPGGAEGYRRPTLGGATATPVLTMFDATMFVDNTVRTGGTSFTLSTASGGEDPNPTSRTAVFSTREGAVVPTLTIDYVPASYFTRNVDRVVRLQDGLNGYTGTADTWISSRSPAVNHGAEQTLQNFENVWGSETSRGLVKFNTSMLSGGGVTVSNAVLALMPFNYQTSTSIPVEVREVLRPWTENATYTTYDGTNAWAASGAKGVGDTSAVIGSTTLDASNWGMVYLDVTSSVQNWALNPTANNGWIIDAVSGTQNIVYGTRSSENVDVYLRPQLWVTYTPEPASLMLLACGGLLALRRRR